MIAKLKRFSWGSGTGVRLREEPGQVWVISVKKVFVRALFTTREHSGVIANAELVQGWVGSIDGFQPT